jgi:hypothetical protein
LFGGFIDGSGPVAANGSVSKFVKLRDNLFFKN